MAAETMRPTPAPSESHSRLRYLMRPGHGAASLSMYRTERHCHASMSHLTRVRSDMGDLACLRCKPCGATFSTASSPYRTRGGRHGQAGMSLYSG